MAQKEIKRRPGTERGDTRSERRSTEVAVAPPDARSARSDARSKPRAVGQELTTANKILVAAAEIDEERETFTAEDLIVVAWKRFPESFGLTGYREQYPDSNRVLSKLMGSVGLCARGWLEQVSTKTYKMTSGGRKLVSSFRTQTDASDGPPPTSGRSERSVHEQSPAVTPPPIRREVPAAAVSAKPERSAAFTSEPRVRTREAPPSVAAAPAAAATRAPEPRSITAASRPAGGTSAFDGMSVLQRLATSVASQKFTRGGLVTFGDACAFWAITPGLNPAQLPPRLNEIEAVLRRAESQIQSAAAPLRINDRLEVTLTSVIGLQGLHKMLTQKYHRELENIRGRPSTEDES